MAIDQGPAAVAATEPRDADRIRERAVRLFRYLAALAELRSKKTRDISAYEASFWFHELPHEPECRTLAWCETETSDVESWLRIDKPIKPPPPRPPVECAHWFKAGDIENTSNDPILHREIVDPAWVSASGSIAEEFTQPHTKLVLEDYPIVKSRWNEYVEREWRPWQRKFKRWETVQQAYRKLFAIYQEQERRGEQYELLVGVGVLVWVNSANHRVSRPAVTVRATIRLEPTSGSISVGPVPDGAEFELEQDMLEVSECPPLQDQSHVTQQLATLDSLWNRQQIIPILKMWLQTLNCAADAEFHDSLSCPERASQTPQMAFAPVLILRKPGGRTMRNALRKIVAQLDGTKIIPDGIRHLCGEHGDSPATPKRRDAVDPPKEILFPLASNDEQLHIVNRIAGRTAVLVQGPPGTGKSHTIVNLVSHFLADGKRVLVTSQTPRALQVLHEKFPDEIRPLIVSLLGEDAKSRDSLELSVQGILRYVEKYGNGPTDPRDQIEPATIRRRGILSKLSECRRRLQDSRKSEIETFQIPGTPYRGSAQGIAQAVARDADRFSWLTEPIAEDAVPPLNDANFGELLSLGESHGHLVPSLSNRELPDLTLLPSASEVQVAVRAWRDAQQAVAAPSPAGVDRELVQRLLALDQPSLEALCNHARNFMQRSEIVDRYNETWTENAKTEMLSGRTASWASLFAVANRAVESAAALIGDATDADLEVPQEILRTRLLADASALLSHLKAGGRLGFWLFRGKVVRDCDYIWKRCRFAGRHCDSVEALESLAKYLTAESHLSVAWREWSAVASPTNGTTRNQIADLKEKRKILRLISEMRDHEARAQRTLRDREGRTPITAKRDWAERVLASATAANAIMRESDAHASLRGIAARVAKCCQAANPHGIAGELCTSLARCDANADSAALATLVQLHEQRACVQRILCLDASLRKSAPKIADAIKNPESRKALAGHLGPFTAAWAWKRATARLARFSSENNPDSLLAEVRELERQLCDATTALIAHKAWASCIDRMDDNPETQGALRAWQAMVRKIAKGFGKHVESDRRAARKYLQVCRSAIPAWIMPINRVVEQVEVEPEIFDVVIVDEASQTGPEGLILQYLGKQCIIVGDDKQISPESGFIDRGEVQTLIDQHLEGIPFKETLVVGTSLFEQAAIRYGHRIALREHFRCMPEIIRFSNELCYRDTPLIPLRQYTSARLPPLQVRFVTDGYREGQRSQDVVNRPEAAAVVKSLIDCLGDPKYSGKSFGVICLQGHAQAQLIESMILDKLGPDPFKDRGRRLLCGDPYSFQGDERDVIFLSMVAASQGDGRNGPLIRETYRQRFNVAASRARDQMWLFHSIRENDLHPDCMRRRLLTFARNPAANAAPVNEGEYDSQFERDVASDLRNAGFRVYPQFEIAGRRIDLVAEGEGGRVAVECDGDAWHGPDEYDADMARQRMLERCGLTFRRVRGSAYYANRARASQSLVEELIALGVTPIRTSDGQPNTGDWISEISGNQCVEALGAYTVNTVQEAVVQQTDTTESGEELSSENMSESTNGEADVDAERNGIPRNADTPTSDPSQAGEAGPANRQADDVNVQRLMFCLLAWPEPLSRAEIVNRARVDAGRFDGVVSNLIGRGLVECVSGKYSLSSGAATSLSASDVSEVTAVESNTWIDISRWASDNNVLEGWQRGVAQSLSFMKRKEILPTPWQIQQGKTILSEAAKLGCKFR